MGEQRVRIRTWVRRPRLITQLKTGWQRLLLNQPIRTKQTDNRASTKFHPSSCSQCIYIHGPPHNVPYSRVYKIEASQWTCQLHIHAWLFSYLHWRSSIATLKFSRLTPNGMEIQLCTLCPVKRFHSMSFRLKDNALHITHCPLDAWSRDCL